MQLVESLANRVCLLQCNALSMIGDRECSLGALNFVFMLWDCTAYAVKMGCVQGDEGLLFIISYSSPDAGRRLFMGVPWVLKNGLSETASAAAVKFFWIGLWMLSFCKLRLCLTVIWLWIQLYPFI